MKKQYSILSVLCVLTLSFFLANCGSKKDETLVTEFNSKKTSADNMLSKADADMKQMKADHTAWTAKLDSVAKLPKSDTAKINGFKAEMKKHEDMAKAASQMISDSIKAAEGAKTENNDQLKAAIAGLDAQMAAGAASWKNVMDAHQKLGGDITAFLGGAAVAGVPAVPATEPAKGGKKPTTPVTPAPKDGKMDETKHPVKPSPGKPRQN